MAIAINLVKINKYFGAQPILHNLNFGINVGEKVGLIGKNGAGKSTLFKILSKQEVPDSGELIITQGLRVAYLEQNPKFAAEKIVKDVLEDALIDHKLIIKRHAFLCDQINLVIHSEKEYEQLNFELQQVEHYLQSVGWNIEQRISKAQSIWGLNDLSIKIENLSGGWLKRLALAQLWLKNPDVLILDEPTNHLDCEQVEKLETWLKIFVGTVLLITHDRYLLDNVVDKILELDKGVINSYSGDYCNYLLEKANQDLLAIRLTEKMKNRLQRELEWLNRGAKARTRKSKIRVESVLNLKIKVQKESHTKIKAPIIEFTNSSNLYESLITIKDLRFCYPNTNNELIFGLNICIQKGQRVAIVGPNGCGKSTIIKILLNELKPTFGSIDKNPKILVSSISQDRWEIDNEISILENISKDALVAKHLDRELFAANYLVNFDFPLNQQKRLAATLSGGEINRLMIAKLMMRGSDVLILDEPTNDLDIPTLQCLSEALLQYKGSVIIVSHDRFFLDSVSTHTLIWNKTTKPKWELYEGNLSTVYRLRAQYKSGDEGPVKASINKSIRSIIINKKRIGITQKEERRLLEIESSIALINDKIKTLEEIMSCSTAFISNTSPGHKALESCIREKQNLEILEAEWLALEEKRLYTVNQ